MRDQSPCFLNRIDLKVGRHADVPGQENGYVVRLEPDVLSTPYPLAPGHHVTVVSRYDASVDHYGDA